MAETTAHAAAERLAREAAFGRLVSRELAGADPTASVPFGDGAEAEDVTHDALVRAWQRWEDLNEPRTAPGERLEPPDRHATHDGLTRRGREPKGGPG